MVGVSVNVFGNNFYVFYLFNLFLHFLSLMFSCVISGFFDSVPDFVASCLGWCGFVVSCLDSWDGFW